MNKLYELQTEDEFEDFKLMQYEDDKKLKELFDKQTHREFQFSLINIGVMLDIVRTYFVFEQQKNKNILLNLEKDKVKNRRVNTILSELNTKINLRYGFDDDTVIIPCLAIYKEELYITIQKTKFITLLIENTDVDL